MIAHPQMIFAAVTLGVAALVGWIFWILPTWSRPAIFFAVSVVPGFRESAGGARILSNYRIQVLIHVVISFGLILTGAFVQRPAPLILGVLWLVVAPLVAVSQAHKEVLPHAVAHSTIREASLEARSTQLPGGWALQFGPFAILTIVAIYLGTHWAQIPDRFPVHWGIDGRPNGWSERTAFGVFGPLLISGALVTGISLMAYSFSHLARRMPVPAGAPAMSDYPHRIAVLLLGVEYFLAAMFSLVGLLPLTGSPGVAPIVILSAALLIAAAFLGRWVSHAHDRLPHAVGMPGDGTPDNCWKLGLFYFNPDDSALFVEKRLGFGYTVNFAHASAWICLALILFLPLLLLFLIYISNHH